MSLAIYHAPAGRDIHVTLVRYDGPGKREALISFFMRPMDFAIFRHDMRTSKIDFVPDDYFARLDAVRLPRPRQQVAR